MTELGLRRRRALAMAQPCARAAETGEAQFAWHFVERGCGWSAILTINR